MDPVPKPPFAGTKTASKRSSLVVMGKKSPAGLFRVFPTGAALIFRATQVSHYL
jgi:hypothetical protein